jgi:transcriptional antiterminator
MDIHIIIRSHKLLLAERTGGLKELALKLALSERSVYNYIGFMKTELNAPIIYQVQKGSYYYERVCEFNFDG